MSDIKYAVDKAMHNLIISGKIEAEIEKQITETVTRSISRQLESYSDFGKALDALVKQAIGVDLTRVKLPEYNAMIADVVIRKVEDYIRTNGEKNIEETLSSILKPNRESILLSELVEEYKEYSRECYDFDYGIHNEVTVHVSKPSTSWESEWIYLDRCKNVDRYSCEFAFLLSGSGVISHLRFKGKNTKEDVFIGGYYGFERTLFQLYAARTKLIIDKFDPHVDEPESDYDD